MEELANTETPPTKDIMVKVGGRLIPNDSGYLRCLLWKFYALDKVDVATRFDTVALAKRAMVEFALSMSPTSLSPWETIVVIERDKTCGEEWVLEDITAEIEEEILRSARKESGKGAATEGDSVNHHRHYNSSVPGIECIDVARHFDFCIGNAIKYLWRAGHKTDMDKSQKEKQIEDLKKAVWYINDEIKQLEKEGARG